MVTFDSLLHKVDAVDAQEVAKENDGQLGKIASIFFDALIKKYDPLVASATDQGANDKSNAAKDGASGQAKQSSAQP